MGKKIILISLGILSGLICLEVFLRLIYGPPQLDMEDNWHYYHQIYEPLAKSFFTQKTTDGKRLITFQRFYASNSHLSVKRPFRKDRQEEEIRIFVIGESVAELFGRVLTECEYAREILSYRFPEKNVNVINAGIGAYTSAHVVPIAREILDYQPDIVLILMGNNIFPNYNLKTWRMLRNPPRFKSLYKTLWTYRKIYESYHSFAEEGFYGVSEFARDYKKVIRLLNTHNVPSVVFTLPADFADFPPVDNIKRKHITPILLIENQNYKEALNRLELQKDPFSIFLKGKVLRAMERYEEARKAYLDVLSKKPTARATPRVNEIIKEIGKKNESFLVQIDQLFTNISKTGLLGDKFFRNQCHWSYEYNYNIVEELTKQLNKKRVAEFAPVEQIPTLNSERVISAFPDFEHKRKRNLMNAVDYAVEKSTHHFNIISLNSIYNFRKVIHTNAAEVKDILQGNPENYIRQTSKINHLTPRIHPKQKNRIINNWHRVLSFAGEAFRQKGYTNTAASFLKSAIARSPESPEAYFSKAKLNINKGCFEQAKKNLLILQDMGYPIEAKKNIDILKSATHN